jgi:hypothetical protein
MPALNCECPAHGNAVTPRIAFTSLALHLFHRGKNECFFKFNIINTLLLEKYYGV